MDETWRRMERSADPGEGSLRWRQRLRAGELHPLDLEFARLLGDEAAWLASDLEPPRPIDLTALLMVLGCESDAPILAWFDRLPNLEPEAYLRLAIEAGRSSIQAESEPDPRLVEAVRAAEDSILRARAITAEELMRLAEAASNVILASHRDGRPSDVALAASVAVGCAGLLAKNPQSTQRNLRSWTRLGLGRAASAIGSEPLWDALCAGLLPWVLSDRAARSERRAATPREARRRARPPPRPARTR